MYPLRDLFISFTLCVTSTFDLDNSDNEDETDDNLIRRTNKINDTITMPILPEGGDEYRPNPIEKGGKMQFEISEESMQSQDRRRSSA